MQNWITEVMEQFGYLGIFLMMALENLFPPIPSEVVLPFGGFLTTYSSLTIVGVLTAATLGSVIGAMILYSIGQWMDARRLEGIIARYGHILRIKEEDMHRAFAWFDKYSYWTVFLCRMVPLIRSLISIPAGMARMRFSAFVLLTTLGTLIWNVILILVGAFLGENWQRIVEWMDMYSTIIYLLLFIGGSIFLYVYVKRKRKS